MRLLHTSDWHLGMQFRGIPILDDQKHFIDEIADIAVREKVDAVLIAGDVFDRSVASAEAAQLYDRAMTLLCRDRGLKVLSIAGNHDGAERLSSCSALLQKGGLYIAGSLEKECMRVDFDDAEIFLLPWFTTGKVKYIYPEAGEASDTLEGAWDYVCGRIRERFAPGKKHILVTHAYIINAETVTSDRSAEAGRASAIGTAAFEGFDYVALGHIHGPQDIGGNIRYSGTPMVYSFGREEKQTKSVTVIDTSSMERRIIPLTPLRKHTTLSGDYETLLKADFPDDVRNGYVRLEVTDSFAGGHIFAILREKYPLLVEMAGRSGEEGTTGSRMTLEELEKEESDPVAIFERYLSENLKITPDEHLTGLFEWAVREYETEVNG